MKPEFYKRRTFCRKKNPGEGQGGVFQTKSLKNGAKETVSFTKKKANAFGKNFFVERGYEFSWGKGRKNGPLSRVEEKKKPAKRENGSIRCIIWSSVKRRIKRDVAEEKLLVREKGGKTTGNRSPKFQEGEILWGTTGDGLTSRKKGFCQQRES